MTRPDCPRLRTELASLRHSRHVTKAMIRRRIADHQRWHRCPHDYDPGHLPRERED